MNIVRFEDWEDLNYNFSTDLYLTCAFGEDAIRSTVKEIIEEHKGTYEVLVRLIFDLNLMCWYFYELSHSSDDSKKEKYTNLSKVFEELYYQTDDTFYKLFENDKQALNYHFNKLD